MMKLEELETGQLVDTPLGIGHCFGWEEKSKQVLVSVRHPLEEADETTLFRYFPYLRALRGQELTEEMDECRKKSIYVAKLFGLKELNVPLPEKRVLRTA